MKKIKLRAHHLLCVKGFEGKGYDEDFINNMKNIVGILGDNAYVEVLNGCDDICVKCPNMKDGKCVSENGGEEFVKIMDDIVLNKMGIKPQEVLNWREAENKVLSRFKLKKDLEGVCSDCSWNDICKWYLTRK
ncbi:MAG: DUF1284 domain-containing protein [Elusimicrobiales bacterium]